MIEIYYAPPSIYGRKVLAVLEEKGLDYEIKRMSFKSEDHKKEEYLKLNPNGEIPTLVDEGSVIYESTAIIEYLNDEYPEPPLMPEDSYARARARMVEDFCDLHMYKTAIKCLIKNKIKGEALDAADQAMANADLKRIEFYLGTQTYVCGQFSLADCAVMTGIATFEALGVGQAGMATAAMKTYISRLKKRAGWKGAAMFTLEAPAAAAV